MSKVIVLGSSASTQRDIFEPLETDESERLGILMLKCRWCDFVVVGANTPRPGTLIEGFPNHECSGAAGKLGLK